MKKTLTSVALAGVLGAAALALTATSASAYVVAMAKAIAGT